MREAHKVARLHAILWGIFSLGGMIAAFLLPVMIYLTGIAYPLGLWPFNGSRDPSFLVSGTLLGILFVFVTIAGSLFHGIFRFQSALTEVGLLRLKRGLEAVGYLIIFVGIVLLAYYLLVLNPSLPALQFLRSILHRILDDQSFELRASAVVTAKNAITRSIATTLAGPLMNAMSNAVRYDASPTMYWRVISSA